MSTVIMKFVAIEAPPERLAEVHKLLKDRGDIESRVVDDGAPEREHVLSLSIAGHPFRVEGVLEEIRRLGVAVNRIDSPPFRFFTPAKRA